MGSTFGKYDDGRAWVKSRGKQGHAVSLRINRAFSWSFVQGGGETRNNRGKGRERERNVGETPSRVRSNVLRPSVSGQTFDHLDIWER